MKAVICQNTELRLDTIPDPVPAGGQVLLEVLRCGICGSDLHARHHCNNWADVMQRSGYHRFMRTDEEVVFGHEFCGEILEYGPGCKRSYKAGTRVCALPVVRHGDNIDLIGLSAVAPGAYAERVVVQESAIMPVPNGLSPDHAALTEPMAVAWHAIVRGEVNKKDTAIVVGCGPVGLAVIANLKSRGVATIIATDLSAARRALATRLGASIVIDPCQESPYSDGITRHNHLDSISAMLELGLGTREKLGNLRISWWHTWRLIDALGIKPKAPVIFECVGAKNIIQSIINDAPTFSRVVVVGVCLSPDVIEPSLAINKEIDLRFALGYTPLEFRDTLNALADGKIDCGPMITGQVGLLGVDAAFSALGDPEKHAKILINPASDAALPI